MKLYLVIIDQYDNEENSIINICTSKEVAENLMEQYETASHDVGYSYHIDEITVDYSKDILWDCYKNNNFRCQ